MTEHVCKWAYTRHEADPDIVYFGILKDGNYIGIDVTSEGVAKDLCSRLNATERLSAKDAKEAARKLGYVYKESRDVLKAYANILEGKDDQIEEEADE